MMTESEAKLDSMARKRARRDGITYAAACDKVLSENPGMYDAYEAEKAAGKQYRVPTPEDSGDDDDETSGQQVGQKRMRKAGLACGQCGSMVTGDQKYCGNCGQKLASYSGGTLA